MYKYEIFEYQNALPRANPIIINLQVTQTLCSIISCAIFPERITSANNFNSNPVILKEFKSSAKRQIFRLSVEVIYVRPGVLKIGSDHAEAQPINLEWKKATRRPLTIFKTMQPLLRKCTKRVKSLSSKSNRETHTCQVDLHLIYLQLWTFSSLVINNKRMD